MILQLRWVGTIQKNYCPSTVTCAKLTKTTEQSTIVIFCKPLLSKLCKPGGFCFAATKSPTPPDSGLTSLSRVGFALAQEPLRASHLNVVEKVNFSGEEGIFRLKIFHLYFVFILRLVPDAC